MKIKMKRDIHLALIERDGLVCGICKSSLEKEYEKYKVWCSVPKNKLIKRRDLIT